MKSRVQRLAGRFAAAHPNHRRIAAGAVTIGLLTIIAKLFVAAREVAIAWRFGVGSIVDAYQLALTITLWLPMLLSSVMTVVLVPRFVALARADRGHFVAELNAAVVILGLAAAGLAWWLAPGLSALLASPGDQSMADGTGAISRRMIPVVFLTILIGYLSARLQARERFAYSVTEAIPALVIAGAVLAPFPATGESRLAWGTSIGLTVQALLLLAMTHRLDGGFGGLRVRQQSSEWKSLYPAFLVMAAGQIVLAVTIPIDQAFAARLGPGAVATLGYASRIIILVTGLATVVLARALLPVFSRSFSDSEFELGAKQARQWSKLLLVLGTVMAAFIWLLADWGVKFLFERGSFTATDSETVAHVLRFGALQVPFYLAGLAAVQWIAASGRYRHLMTIACFAVVIKVLMNLLLASSLGLAGLMIATAAMYAFSFACQYFVAKHGAAPGNS